MMMMIDLLYLLWLFGWHNKPKKTREKEKSMWNNYGNNNIINK